MKHVRQTVLAALEHQDFPTLLLVERLKPARDLSRPPICQVMFVLDKPHGLAEQGAPTFVHGETGPTMNSGGLVLESFPLEHRSASLDLVLLVVESSQSLSISMRYNAELFDHSTIVRFGKYFETLLGHVVTQPDVQLSALADAVAAKDQKHRLGVRNELEILDDNEQELLVKFNDTESPYPDDVSIHRQFEDQVQRTPDQIALEFEDQHLTYAQLNDRANQVANYLRALGVGPEVAGGDLHGAVPRDGRRAHWHPEGWWSLYADGSCLPAGTNSLHAGRCACAGAVDDGAAARAHAGAGARLVCLDSDWESIARESCDNPPSLTEPDNLAYVIYTSGSTGQPKGVMVEHRGLSNTVKWLSQTLAITPDDSTLLKTPITFDAAGREIFPRYCQARAW